MIATMDVLLGSFVEVGWKIVEKRVIAVKTKRLRAFSGPFSYTLKYILQAIMKNCRAKTSFAVHSV